MSFSAGDSNLVPGSVCSGPWLSKSPNPRDLDSYIWFNGTNKKNTVFSRTGHVFFAFEMKQHCYIKIQFCASECSSIYRVQAWSLILFDIQATGKGIFFYQVTMQFHRKAPLKVHILFFNIIDCILPFFWPHEI